MASKGRSGTRATSTSRERQQSLQEALRRRPESPQTGPDAAEEEDNTTILQQRRTPRRAPFEQFRSEIRAEIAELRNLVANAQLQDSTDDWTASTLAAIAEAIESSKESPRDKHELSFIKQLVLAPTEEKEKIITQRTRTLTAATLHGWSFATQIQRYETCQRQNIPCMPPEPPALRWPAGAINVDLDAGDEDAAEAHLAENNNGLEDIILQPLEAQDLLLQPQEFQELLQLLGKTWIGLCRTRRINLLRHNRPTSASLTEMMRKMASPDCRYPCRRRRSRRRHLYRRMRQRPSLYANCWVRTGLQS